MDLRRCGSHLSIVKESVSGSLMGISGAVYESERCRMFDGESWCCEVGKKTMKRNVEPVPTCSGAGTGCPTTIYEHGFHYIHVLPVFELLFLG